MTQARDIADSNFTSIGGLQLGGTGAANLLDDYEVGTFTPTLGASVTNPTFSSRQFDTGNYVKIGDIVHYSYYSGLVAFTSAGSGTAFIGGLPFTAVTSTSEYWLASFQHGTALATSSDGGYIVPGTTTQYFIQENNLSGATWIGSGNGYLMVTGTYRAA